MTPTVVIFASGQHVPIHQAYWFSVKAPMPMLAIAYEDGTVVLTHSWDEDKQRQWLQSYRGKNQPHPPRPPRRRKRP